MRTVTTPLVLILVAVVMGFLAMRFYDAPPPPPVSTGLVSALIGGPRALKPLSLTNHHGKILDLDGFKEQWTLVFFGYTHCPDVCPTTLYHMAEALRLLDEQTHPTGPVKGLFISVDPDRDPPTRLAEYVGYFHPDLVAVTGQRPQVDAVAQQFGAPYRMLPPDPNNPESYAVVHAASLYFVDPDARLVEALLDIKDPTAILHTLSRLQADFSTSEQELHP